MLLEFFTRKYRKESSEKNQEILRLKDEIEKLKEENKRLNEIVKFSNIKRRELNNKNIELKSDILKLFQFLGIKENSYLIPVIQMNNKDLINKIFKNIKEPNEIILNKGNE